MSGPDLPISVGEPSPRGLWSFTATVVVIVLLLVGLPLAVWLDLRNLTDRSLVKQATELGRVIDGIREYYSSEIVGNVKLGKPGEKAQIDPDYKKIPGAIPIPATLSLELGSRISAKDKEGSTGFRFFSDYPFPDRVKILGGPHHFDAFEKNALDSLRQDSSQVVWDLSGSFSERKVRLITPILMKEQCVGCHNTRADSPKRDWKVNDVRGIEEFEIQRPIETSILAFRYLLSYFAFTAIVGIGFIALQRRQTATIRRVNGQLGKANVFFADLAGKLGRYLSPQLYRSIFSGEKEVKVATERKKLTIFFSDIIDFTATTERLQPEELTALLNDYLTEMSAIAGRHGGTVDKFIGDAILVFFGDPTTKGVAEDATACLQMAIEMQRRLQALNAKWRNSGVERPFRVRMGINTGFCDVGNFGSDDRMEYTIIGAEANLSARLQTIAEAGGIVLSYETYALVRDVVRARPLPAITVKGVSRTIVPYAVEGLVGEEGQREQVVSEHATGLDLFLDTGVIEPKDAERAILVLKDALAVLEGRRAGDLGSEPPA